MHMLTLCKSHYVNYINDKESWHVSCAHSVYHIYKRTDCSKTSEKQNETIEENPFQERWNTNLRGRGLKRMGKGRERPFEHLSAHSNGALVPLFLPPP